jgi:hypothetical protein
MALFTFGPHSEQYRSIKSMIDEHTAQVALSGLNIGTSESESTVDSTATGEGAMDMSQ